MHIGIDIRCLMTPERTGVGEYAAELLTAIFSLDTQNEYYLFYNAGTSAAQHLPRWEHPNVRFASWRWPNKLFNSSTLLLRTPRIDRLVTERFHLPGLDVFYSPNLNFTALQTTTKHFLTIHDLSFDLFPEYFSPKQRLWHRLINPRKQCAQAKKIIVPSEHTKSDLEEHFGIPSEKIRVIYPGLSESFRRKLSQLSDIRIKAVQKRYRLPERFVLFLGTVEPRKNTLAVLRGFEEYRRQHPGEDLHLVVAGGAGWQAKVCVEAMRASPFSGAIHCLDYIAPDDKPAVYRLAKVFIFPSFYEGFGFPVLEAMAAGVPVITCVRSSLGEVVENAAYLVNAHWPNEIAVGLDRILHTPSLAERLRTLGLGHHKKFVWKKTAQEWLALALES